MNLQSKHTAGPWIQTHEGGWITQKSNHFKIIVYDEGKFDDEEGCANARLIASAPELLEALKKIVKLSEASDHTDADLNGIEAVANEAISKAEGLTE